MISDKTMEDPLINKKAQCNKVHKFAVGGMGAGLLLVLVVFILSIVTLSSMNKRFDTLETDVMKVKKSIKDVEPAIPSKFILPHTSYTPVVSQGGRGTCWNFAQVGVLEGSYRANGYEKGFLKENEYVKFSEQGFSKKYVDYCQSTKANPDKWCVFGGMLLGEGGNGTTSDGEIELMYYMYDHVYDGLYPESVCPYIATPGDHNENEKVCEHEADAHNGNPLSWRVTDLRSVYDIGSARELMYKSKTACGFSSVLYSTVFTIPCDASDAAQFVKDSNECKKCIWKRADGTCEYKQITREYDWGGHFINHYSHGQDFIRVLGGHAQTVIGYNDDWVTDLGGVGDPADYETGALILKNSWGADKGHSVDFLMGKISMIEERNKCPMHGDPKNWVPMNHTCLNTTKDASKCMQNQKQLLRDNWVYGATPLICKAINDSFFKSVSGIECSPNKTYYLSSYVADEYNNTTPGGQYIDGAPAGYQDLDGRVFMYRPIADRPSIVFRIIEFDDVTKEVKLSLTKDANWWLLGSIFGPKELVHNDPVLCGYYPMPYSTMGKDNVNQPQNDKDSSSITCFDIEWDDHSYLAAKNTKFDYKYLVNSTKTDTTHNVVGPFHIYAPDNKFAKPHREL